VTLGFRDRVSGEEVGLLRRLSPYIAALSGALLIGLIITHAEEFSSAVQNTSVEAVLALAALHWLALFLRALAWNGCLVETGRAVPAKELHLSSALRFLVDTVAPTYVGAGVRIGLLKAILGQRAPTAGQMLSADGVMFVFEGAIMAVALAVLAASTNLSFAWVGIIAAATLLGVALVIAVRRRFAGRPFVRALAVLSDRRRAAGVTLLLAGVLAVQPVRFWIALNAVGVDASMVEAVLAFVVASLYGALPVGPGPAGLGATASLFAAEGIGVAAAIGVLLAATAMIAALAYSAVAILATGARPVLTYLATARSVGSPRRSEPGALAAGNEER